MSSSSGPDSPFGAALSLSRHELTAAVAAGGRQERLRDVLAGLNAPQRLVATRPDGPLLVVAGPGAGKTRAIIGRVAHLLLARGVSPDEIMAITFSRRAAGELQARLAVAVGSDLLGGETVWAGTFHALAMRILRREGARQFGRPPNFTIYDRDDTEQTLKRLLEVLGVPAGQAGRLAISARQALSLVKRQAAPPEGQIGEGQAAVPLGELLSRYEDELRAAAAFDFDDLVANASVALERDQRLRAWIQRRCRHLLVDEYQDTDPAQEGLLRRLRLAAPAPSHDLCVVADPEQSIYAFRGAVPEQVHRFAAHWPGAGLIRLEQNYRSTKSIVAIARRLVTRDAPAASAETAGPSPQASLGRAEVWAGLRLWTENPPGRPARLWVAPHPEKEADAIAGDIAVKIADGWLPEDIAVLVRTRAQVRPLEAALLRAKVPYALAGGVPFFAREEVKDALSYLRLAALPADAAAFWRIVNTPRRGLGPAAVLAIARSALSIPALGRASQQAYGLAQADQVDGVGQTDWPDQRNQAPGGAAQDVLGGMPSGRPVAGARVWASSETAPDGLYDLLAHIDELTALELSGAGPKAVLAAALALTGYRDWVLRQHPDDAPLRLDVLAELLRLAGTYPDTRPFLDDAALAGEVDDPAVVPARVRLSTVHAAKGLEFRAVYVAGCEQGLFPLQRESAVSDAAGHPQHPPPVRDAEERRVFYVAVTRAREVLTLSYCTFRREARTVPSPYLAEIGRGLLRRAQLGTDEAPQKKREARGHLSRAHAL